MAPKRSLDEAQLIRAALSALAAAKVLCDASTSDRLFWLGSLSALLQADSRHKLIAAAAAPLLDAWAAAAAGGGDATTCRLLLVAAAGDTPQNAVNLCLRCSSQPDGSWENQEPHQPQRCKF